MPERWSAPHTLTGLFHLWTRRTDPPFYFSLAAEAFVRRTRETNSSGQLVALVDDVVPRALLGRSAQEAAEVNDSYRRALAEAGFASSVFASEAGIGGLATLFDLDDLTYSHFQRVLPGYKSTAGISPEAYELLVFASQFALLKWGIIHIRPDIVVAGSNWKRFLDVCWSLVPRVETLYMDILIGPQNTRR